MPLVHQVDQHSKKSVLTPPSLRELEQLAKQIRKSQPRPLPIEPAQVPTRSLRRRLPPQAIADLGAQYIAGETVRALSREYDVSRGALCELLQGEGVTLRAQGITADDAEIAMELYETGLSIREVAQRVGYSYGTIRTMLQQKGVVRRP